MKKADREFEQICSFIRNRRNMENGSGGTLVQVKAGCLSIVQPAAAQLGDDMRDLPEMPPFLALITFTNHTEILNRCRRMEERVFYILYPIFGS